MASRAPTRERLDPEVFRLPVERIREGYYSDAYFNLTRDLLLDVGRHPQVTIQAFQKQHSVLGGIDEAIAVLKLCAEDWTGLEVQALHEADEIEPWEPVLQIDGDYSLFAHLETVYLGVLSRRTRIMRNVRRVVEAANGKPILFFPARHDHWLVQTGDGWAAHVAGAIGERLWGVRLDTSELMVDRSLWPRMGDLTPTGVNQELVRLVREGLDAAGHRHVHIVVSGGFDADKIAAFERDGAPVDAYGVGSSLVQGANDFTADVVRLDGEDCAKAGRRFRPNPRLERVV